MAEEFQTTFIPKQGLAPNPKTLSTKKKVKSIITLITFLIFIFSAAIGGYLFFRQKLILSQIESITEDLQEVSKTLDDQTIRDITAMSDRLRIADGLLEGHLASSEVFQILQRYTLPSVGFNSFTYAYNKDSIRVAGLGTAAGFGSIVVQSDKYGASGYLRDVIFSNLQSNPETGTVSFTFEAKLDPGVVMFKNLINSEGRDLPANNEGEN